MDINTNPNPTQLASTTWRDASGVVMPTRGCTFGTSPATARAAGISIDPVVMTIVADRKAIATKGHVGFAAYVPGFHAWSPPPC